MKLFNLFPSGKALLCASLLTFLFALTSFSSMAAEESANYQSPFDDYKPLSDDNLSDWKSINVPSNGSGHAGHSMSGMQHEMTPEQMANMSSDSKEMSGMEDMDHSSMEGMDHGQMKHDKTMAPMAGIDHSKMAGMDHDNMKSMSDSKPAMQPIKKEDMPEMSQDKMAGHNHGGSDMNAMDHSKMSESKPNEMQPSHEDAAQDESKPHEHPSEQGAEHAEMSMPSIATPSMQSTPWQIIPNLHPVIVHFPIALTLVAFLLSVAAYVRRSQPVAAQLAAAGHFTLWLAAIGAAIAVLFGWLAFNSVNHDDAGHAAMLLHRAWAIPTAIALILLASWDAWKHRVNELMSIPALIIIFVLSGAVTVTAWLGGEVVYRHGIGVLSLPVSEGGGHGHHHGADATDKAKAGSDEHTEQHNNEKGESHEH